MPGTALVPQTPTTTGAVVTRTAAAAQNSIPNNGKILLLVVNGSGSSINATAIATLTADGTALGNKVVAVAAGAEKVIGPFPPGIYNFADGTMELDISVITSVTIAVLQCV